MSIHLTCFGKILENVANTLAVYVKSCGKLYILLGTVLMLHMHFSTLRQSPRKILHDVMYSENRTVVRL